MNSAKLVGDNIIIIEIVLSHRYWLSAYNLIQIIFLSLCLSHRLYVGLSVGIPIVLVLIIAVIVLYCCWWNRNRKKRLQLMQLYLASRVNCDRDEIRTLDAAPPPYTPTENDELPSYTKDDPYSSLKEDSTEGDLERSDESSQNDSNNHIEEIPLLQS